VTKEIWLGPVLGTNRERLLARCAEFVSAGRSENLLYLAASHPLLDLVTDKLLDGRQATGVWGEFPVYLFRGFIRRVLAGAEVSQASGSAISLVERISIDREELPLRRSLVSQIIKQLSARGLLQAIRPLANRDGCVNTIASLIGELQRAGKTPQEFQQVVAERSEDIAREKQINRETKQQKPDLKDRGPRSQLDFDREVALIYSVYTEALDRFCLTDEDADQLRALQILRGDLNGNVVSVPWLNQVELLVLDGFFDFTPVQGEILKCLIPAIPNVIVNLNGDSRNEDIFRPFESTVEHLESIADFAIIKNEEVLRVSKALSSLRERLFNVTQVANLHDEQADELRHIKLLECSDREVEIRSIAKEIKRLTLAGEYQLSDIALVVRQRAAYAETIQRVFADESIPCNLERREEAQHVPAVRAAGKLFQLLKDTSRENVKNPKAADLAHLVKTDYFRIPKDALVELVRTFESKFADSFPAEGEGLNLADEKQRARLGVGLWLPDVLENVIAYVGSELRVTAWIDRALKLILEFPSPEAAQSLISGDANEADNAVLSEDEAPLPEEGAPRERRKRPAPIHPVTIAWAVILMGHLQSLIAAAPEEGSPEGLRSALMRVLDQLEFSRQVSRPLHRAVIAVDVPQATLDVRGLEALRRAIAAAVRTFNYAHTVVTADEQKISVPLSSFIDEVERCLHSQVLAIGAANRDGLRVLEATDVRGLHFRVVFIAGMIEGGFPLRTSRDWLYPHEERLRLQKQGVFLEDISTDTLLKEEHYFYQAACRAIDRLYLSRPLALSDGSETVASYYLEELRRAIAPAEIEIEQVRGDLDTRELHQASTATELATFLVRRSERNATAQFAKLLSQAQSLGYISASARRRVANESERNNQTFGPFDGDITQPELRAMISRHFGPEHVYSASRLSTYGNCAFRFFGNRVLRLEPRSEAALDLQAIDAGKLLHDILRRFFQLYRGEYLPGLDREELRRRMSETADRVFREHELRVPPLNQRIWKIDCEIRKLILDQVLLYELRLQEITCGRQMLPSYFELAFGQAQQASDPKSSKQFLKYARSDNTEFALIQGQIDRVDVDRHGQVAVAYDYKLSQGARTADIESGRQVQIPIYLAALEQLFLPDAELAGGGYYRLRARGPRLNQGLYRRMFEDCTDTTRNSKFDDLEWQRLREAVRKRVWEFIDGMRAGHFRVKPSLGKATCKFCDYAAVCRYDPYRIGRKRG
jgi:ATP-dependent helicase/DNAse subunit B